MNRKVCDCTFISQEVNTCMNVNQSILKLLSAYRCLFVSVIWWSLWMRQGLILNVKLHFFFVVVKIKMKFYAKDFAVVSDDETLDKHYLFLSIIFTHHIVNCSLPLHVKSGLFQHWIKLSYNRKGFLQTNPLQANNWGLKNTHWHTEPQKQNAKKVVNGKTVMCFSYFVFRHFRKIAKNKYYLFHVCPSACPHRTAGLAPKGFSRNLMFAFFSEIYVEKIKV